MTAKSTATARVLVLGGSGVVGGAIVRALTRKGARVAFTYCTREAHALALAQETSATAYAFDAGKHGETSRIVDAAARELGTLDALVHAIGVPSIHEPARFDTIETGGAEFDEAGWDRLMAINVRSAFVAAARAASHMPHGGNIVFIGSIDGEKGVPTAPPYATSKAALSGAARALAKSLGPKNIRVNVLAPGILEAGASAVVPAEIRAEYLKHSNSKRYGTSEEIARTALYFALDNTYVTGKTLVCDGGV